MNTPGYTGQYDSQANRENFVYDVAQGRLGSASTTMLVGPPQVNGTRVTLSAYIHNTNPTQVRQCTLRMVPDGGSDSSVNDFFYRELQPKETFILPLILVKGLRTLKGLSDVTDEVNFFINYKQEL